MRISDWSSDVCSSDLIGLEADLMPGLVEGRLDIGVMYTPQSRPGLKVEPLFEERLILVSTDPAGQTEPGPEYTYIDWGPEFYARHSASFPEFMGPALTANIGWLGLQHILERSEEHTSELQSLMRISYAVFSLKKNK